MKKKLYIIPCSEEMAFLSSNVMSNNSPGVNYEPGEDIGENDLP